MKDYSKSAFPIHPGVSCEQYCGMSLRDYFAANAPKPPKWWIDCYGKNLNDLQSEAELISAWNYSYADAMLVEREK